MLDGDKMPTPIYIRFGIDELDSSKERIPWDLLMEYVHNCC